MKGIHKKRKGLLNIIIIYVLICFTGCLSMTRMGLNNADAIYDELVKSMMDLPNAQVAIEGMPGMALMIAALISLSPENPKLLGLGAMAYGCWGMLVEDERKEYAMELYQIGESYGLRGLKCLDDDIKEGIEKDGKDVIDFTDQIEMDNMDVVFWYVLCKALRMFGDMENPYILAEAGNVIAVIDRIAVLDPSYFFYCPALFQATIAAFGGPMMGYTHVQANKMFKEALAKTDNKMLLGHWLYARFYAVTIMDEKLFDETVEYVLETPNSALPGGQLINAIAKIKVRKLKENKEKFF